MVGLVHKLLFDLVESLVGAEAVSEVKRRAGVPADKTFRMDEAYDDEEWRRLLAAACDVLEVSQQQAEETYADFFLIDALQRWPMWFQMSRNSREFLERQPKIHNGFATGVHDVEAGRAINDKFRLETSDKELVMHYRSPNQLCGLYQALARWIINHYGDEATIEETRCLKKGDPECEIHVCWASMEKV